MFNSVKTIRTIKLKICVCKKADAILPKWLEACNWLSKIIFDSKEINSNRLAQAHYKTVREKFELPSQLTCTLFRTVSATYKSMKTQKKWNLATYKKNIIPIVFNRDFANRKRFGLTIWSEKITIDDPRPIPQNWKDSKIFLKNGQWYLNLSYEIDIPEPLSNGKVVGVDQGIKRLFVASSGNDKLFYKADHLNHKLANIRKTRAKVQAVGTRSSKRLLKRMSSHEKSVTEHAVHVASKRLVQWADSIGARKIVIENLTHIRESSLSKGKQLRTKVNRWPFYKFAFCVTYKAAAYGITVEEVSPKNTSRMCHKCGHVEKSNRNGFDFVCKACGYMADADWNASKNIAGRAISIGLNSIDTGSCKPPKGSTKLNIKIHS